MSTREDIESFFTTLLLGDFEENQNTAAQIIGGLISLIPVLDQVMDARDVSGALYQINRRGGFQQADSTQLVNLGFASFGAIPEVGSAFKTVFKPLWKERRAVKGAVHGGLEAVEGLLGLGKGGAIRWVRTELLGKWGARTQQMIATVEMALASCIELTEFIATAGGWKDWLIPGSIQKMARDMLPGLRKLQKQIREPMGRASEEIRLFLEDLLGEQAAAIAMGVGQRAAIASAVPGTRSKSGHNAADLHPKGKAHKPEPAKKVASDSRTNAAKGGGSVHAEKQNTGRIVDKLTNEIVGISGEHIADYICAYTFGWGKHWQGHDQGVEGHWAEGLPDKKKLGKLSKGGKPKMQHALYKLSDGANGTGIDAVWRATPENNDGKLYAIVEAKASRDEDAPKFLRKLNNTRKPGIAGQLADNAKKSLEAAQDASELIEPLEEGTTPRSQKSGGGKASGKSTTGKPLAGKQQAKAAPNDSGSADTAAGKKEILVQMSHEWIAQNIKRAVPDEISDEILLKRGKSYARHLFYSPFFHLSGSPKKHMESKLSGAAQAEHAVHDAFHYGDGAVKVAVNKRKATLRKKYSSATGLKEE